jgi:hypothetical protein
MEFYELKGKKSMMKSTKIENHGDVRISNG